MIALLDTNVVLDVLLKRPPFAQNSAAVFAAVETGRVRGVLGATSFTTIHYLVEKQLTTRAARGAVSTLVSLFDVAAITRAVIEGALQSKLIDFENAVLEQAGMSAGADVIVTRNVRDFVGSAVQPYSPGDFLKLL